MVELIIAFRNFANAPKNSNVCLVNWPFENYELQIRSQGLLHIVTYYALQSGAPFSGSRCCKNVVEMAPQMSVANSIFIQQVL